MDIVKATEELAPTPKDVNQVLSGVVCQVADMSPQGTRGPSTLELKLLQVPV